MIEKIGANSNLCIVIPCYNEEKGIKKQDYRNFIKKNPKVLLCFVDDGSTDSTLSILNEFKATYPEQVDIFSCKKNGGKAEAVKQGINYCNANYTYQYIAYLDADLATTLDECYSLTSYFDDNISYVFGSRILKVGSTIVRNKFRFLTGRIIATAISNILKLHVYDTQCGCKLFTKELSKEIFKDSFISKWLFDVEIFHRIMIHYGKDKASTKMLEVPLKSWIDKGDSKVKMTYFFKLWVDLYRINKICKTNA